MKILIALKITFLLVLFLSLIACTPNQRPLRNGQGYVVVPVSEKQFRIEYYLKHATLAETYWNTTAGQLCPGGFRVLYNKKHIIHFDMYVPIAGNSVNLGRQEFIQYGEVICNGEASNTIQLTETRWQEFNRETGALKPVSERWLIETLKLYVHHLSDLPVKNSVQKVTQIWGKPRQQSGNNNELFSVWVKGGDSWFPNQVGLLEQNNSLKLVVIFPGVSSYMAELIDKSSLQVKDFQTLIMTGALPAYFYRPQCSSLKNDALANVDQEPF